MSAPKGENHPYNRLQKHSWDQADEIRDLRKELAETRWRAGCESNLHDMTRKDLADVRLRLAEQCADHRGYKAGMEDSIRLLLRCNDKRIGEGLSALFG